MSRLLWRASLRHLLRHPGQIGLSVLGIALGVAVALSIDTMVYDHAFATFCMMVVVWIWWVILNFLSCQDTPASRVSFARG